MTAEQSGWGDGGVRWEAVPDGDVIDALDYAWEEPSPLPDILGDLRVCGWRVMRPVAVEPCGRCGGDGSTSESVVHPTNPAMDSWRSVSCGRCNGTGRAS